MGRYDAAAANRRGDSPPLLLGRPSKCCVGQCHRVPRPVSGRFDAAPATNGQAEPHSLQAAHLGTQQRPKPHNGGLATDAATRNQHRRCRSSSRKWQRGAADPLPFQHCRCPSNTPSFIQSTARLSLLHLSCTAPLGNWQVQNQAQPILA